MTRQPTRRMVIGEAYEAMGRLIDLSPSNPANMKRLAMIDRPRAEGLRTIRNALLEMEDGLREYAFEDLRELNERLEVEVARIKEESQ